MKRLLTFLLTCLVALALVGCGSDRERGKNRDKDVKPREPSPTDRR
jgi:hypothetical protein